MTTSRRNLRSNKPGQLIIRAHQQAQSFSCSQQRARRRTDSLATYFGPAGPLAPVIYIREESIVAGACSKAVMLNAYNNKTDIIFCFHSEKEIPYDYRDQEEQRRIIRQQFRNEGWRTRELLEELLSSRDFYFDKMCQVRMPSWTKGRVALVGDAGYCASPAAGMGGSLAIVGATALADAFKKYPEDYEAAFQQYSNSLRPFVEDVQAQAVNFGLEMFVPRSEEALEKRNTHFNYSEPKT